MSAFDAWGVPKSTWLRRGKDFAVEIVRWHDSFGSSDWRGPWRWNVYAYIYTPHRRYVALKDAPRECSLPFHGGISFQKIGEGGTVVLGSDYGHYRDERFSHFESLDDASEVVRDADELYRALSDEEQEEE